MNLGNFLIGGLPLPPLPPGLPSLPGFPGGVSSNGAGGIAQPTENGMGGTTHTGDMGYPQNIAGLLQMLGGNQANPSNMNLMRGGLI